MTGEDSAVRLSCRVEPQGQTVVVTATGDIDAATQWIFADAVRDALNRPSQSVVIDLAGVTFLGSPGLAVLVEAHENAMRMQRELRVAIGNSAVRRSIELTGLAKILPLVSDLETALQTGR